MSLTKQCQKCGTVGPAEGFTYQGCHRNVCKKCKNRASVQYKNKRNLGITAEEYDQMWFDQDGLCAICGRDNKKDEELMTDHCHKSNTVRGLLCRKCNMGLGYFDDNVSILATAIRYIDGHLNGR